MVGKSYGPGRVPDVLFYENDIIEVGGVLLADMFTFKVTRLVK